MHLKIDTVLIADTVTKTETVSVSSGLTLPEAKITQMSGKYHLKLHLSGCANDKLTTVSSKLFVLNRRRKKRCWQNVLIFQLKSLTVINLFYVCWPTVCQHPNVFNTHCMNYVCLEKCVARTRESKKECVVSECWHCQMRVLNSHRPIATMYFE